MGAARVLGADLVAELRFFAATLDVMEAVGSNATVEPALEAVRQAGRVSVIAVSWSSPSRYARPSRAAGVRKILLFPTR